MTIYLSGPMSSKFNLNRPAFAAAARVLRFLGNDVVNPHDLTPERIDGEPDEAFYERCMEIDLAALRECDAIYLLEGWQGSKGAQRELAEAREIGLDEFEGGIKLRRAA